ncbi:hypothetical protein [Rhizobium leguminosarum]
MKTLIAATLTAMTFLTAGLAEAAGNRLEFQNYSGEDVIEVHMRGPLTEWGHDLLGSRILEDGESLSVRRGNQCELDIMLVSGDGVEHVLHENVCAITGVELTDFGDTFHFSTY